MRKNPQNQKMRISQKKVRKKKQYGSLERDYNIVDILIHFDDNALPIALCTVRLMRVPYPVD